MMRFWMRGISMLCVMAAAAGVRAETLSFDSSADTFVTKTDSARHGGDQYLFVQGGSMNYVGYVRFDLSGLRIKSIDSATLVFTVHGSLPKPPYRNDTLTVDRIAVYGLNEVSGNTPQNWNETMLASGSIGGEMSWTTGTIVTANGRTTDLDGDVNGVTETVVSAAGGAGAFGTRVVIEGEALARFIKSRAAGSGLVTFILKNDDSNYRGFGFCSKEYTDPGCRPMLEISGDIRVKPKTIFLTSPCDNNGDGIQDDAGWVDWLKTQGLGVDVRQRFWSQTLTESEIVEFNAADLLIVSRALDIGDLSGLETAKWNALTRPLLLMNPWMARNNRWKWINSADVRMDAGTPPMFVRDPNYAFFTGVTLDAGKCVQVLDPNVGTGHTAFFKDVNDAGNGTVLSLCRGRYQSVWIAQWAPGVEYYPGAGMVAGGRRVLFSTGTQDAPYADENGLPMPVGVFNLTPAGQRILGNMVDDLLTQTWD